MKELKPSTKLDGTPEENERAIQRIIYSLSEEEKAESMSDKYAYLREGGADIFLDYFMLIIQDYVCTLPGSYSREIFLFVLCYTNQYSC